MYLGLISVLTEYDASKYALCTFFHFTMRYTGILRTLEILYMCARVFTFKTQQNNKKSFLLNDLHLRNRDKPLTVLFLCYNLVSLYILSKKIVTLLSASFPLFLFFVHGLKYKKTHMPNQEYLNINYYQYTEIDTRIHVWHTCQYNKYIFWYLDIKLE